MKLLYNIIQRLFDFMAQKVCFTFAVSFFSVLGAVAAVPGIVLIWATIPYENPFYFYSEIIFSIVLLFIFALIHRLLYGLGRLWGEIFYTLKEAKTLIEKWRMEYNTFRPHSSLKYRPPAPEAYLN
jgi:hypothetical protein